jgi:hypothetical protein
MMKRKNAIYMVIVILIAQCTLIWCGDGDFTITIKDKAGNDILPGENVKVQLWGYLYPISGENYWINEIWKDAVSNGLGGCEVTFTKAEILAATNEVSWDNVEKFYFMQYVHGGSFWSRSSIRNPDALWGSFTLYNPEHEHIYWDVNTINESISGLAHHITPNGVFYDIDLEGTATSNLQVPIYLNYEYSTIETEQPTISLPIRDYMEDLGYTFSYDHFEGGLGNLTIQNSSGYDHTLWVREMAGTDGEAWHIRLSGQDAQNVYAVGNGYYDQDNQRLYVDFDYTDFDDAFTIGGGQDEIYCSPYISYDNPIDYTNENPSGERDMYNRMDFGFIQSSMDPIPIIAPVNIGDNRFFSIQNAIDSEIAGTIEITKGYHTGALTEISISETLIISVVDESYESRTETMIDGNITVTADNSLTISDVHITGTLTNSGSGTVTATHCYWGDATGPASGDIVGTVSYVPWYTDAEMTTLGYPVPDVSLDYDGESATLTWTNDGFTYSVYGTNDPNADWPWSQLTTGLDAGTYTASQTTYQFFAVKAGSWNDAVTKVGYFEYDLNKMDGGTGHNYVGLCLDFGYTTNTEMAEGLGLTNGEMISIWDTATQSWISSPYDGSVCDPELALSVGMSIDVTVNADKTVYLTGDFPENWASFDFITTNTTDMNLVYLPLNKLDLDVDDPTNGIQLNEVGSVLNNGQINASSVSIWNETYQGWQTTSYIQALDLWLNGDIDVNIGQPLMIGASQNFTWPE